MRCLVEASWGLGDIIQATRACRALHALGYDVDFFVNSARATALAPLFAGEPALGRVLVSEQDVAWRSYDFALSCLGKSAAAERLPPGFCFRLTWRDVLRDGMTAALVRAARELGFEGPAPRARVREDPEGLDVPARAIVVHAGSDPLNAFKRWGGWGEICARARARGYHPIIVGRQCDLSGSGWERQFELRLELPLARLAALIARAHAYLGNDSGLGHIAAAVGARGLLLFGPTDPAVFAPPGGRLVALDAPLREGEGRHPLCETFVPIERHDVESVWRAVEAVLQDPCGAPEEDTLERAALPRPPAASLPTPEEIRAAPPTLEAADELFRRITAAAVFGLARSSDDAGADRWRAEVARASGLAHLAAAETRRRDRTRIGHRRARGHLREAWRTGYRLQALARKLRLALTPRSRPVWARDPWRY